MDCRQVSAINSNNSAEFYQLRDFQVASIFLQNIRKSRIFCNFSTPDRPNPEF